jgi:general secretion pathway protein K
MLGVILLCFNRQSDNDLRAAEGLRKTCQAYNCARSGLNVAIAAIRSNPDIDSNKLFADLFSGEKVFNADNCKCSVKVTDETGKINLNRLIDEQGRPGKGTIEQVLRLIDVLNRHPGFHIDYSIVPALVDWVDSDENVSSLPLVQGNKLGAESAYYMKLNPPYKCKNMPLEAIDELLPVKGVTLETFERIRNYITVYGDGKININSAPKEAIESLSEKMDTGLAQAIIDKRNFKFFDNISELRQFPWMTETMYNEIKDKLTTKPTEKYYTITARADIPEGYTITATVKLNTNTKKIDVVWYKEISRDQGK